MTVEIRTVHTGELRLAAHGQAAAAAHARSVDHDRVHADSRFNTVFLRELANEFHHNQRANSNDFVVLLAAVYQAL